MSTKKAVAAPAPERRPAQPNHAMDAFEKAMKALGKRDYEKARDLFESLIDDYGHERELVERARAYRTLCQRSLDSQKRPSPRPKAFDDLLNQGVFLHNRGDYDEALKLLRQAAELQPQNDSVQYCLAATSARSGDSAAAIKALRTAIAVNPASRAQARSDSDFDALRTDDAFAQLLQRPAV
jgi:tetratricopeptide (TPR) repeat protein